MPIVNRELDVSQQKDVYQFSTGPGVLGAGVTNTIAMITSPGNLKAASIAGYGLSGAPVVSLEILRFNVGAGITGILLGATLTITAQGTSGVQAFTLPAAGSTLLSVVSGDMLVLRNIPANTACSAVAAVVVQATQDIKTQLGSST